MSIEVIIKAAFEKSQ